MPLKSPKVEFGGGQKPQNFNQKSGIKFRKVLQTSQFLLKNCILVSSCLLFTKNMNICFHLQFIADFKTKKSNFCNFHQFLDPLLTLRPPYSIKEALIRVQNLPKAWINFYYWKMQLYLTLVMRKCHYSVQR